MREVMRITKQRYRKNTKNKNMFNPHKATQNELLEYIQELEARNSEPEDDASDDADMGDDESD